MGPVVLVAFRCPVWQGGIQLQLQLQGRATTQRQQFARLRDTVIHRAALSVQALQRQCTRNARRGSRGF